MLHLIAGALEVIRRLIANPAAGIPAAILGRLAFVYVKPYRQHRRCEGRGCRRCRGTGLKRRWGAYHVHKVKLSLQQAWEERGER